MHRVGQRTCQRCLLELRRRHLSTEPPKPAWPSSLTTAIASRLTTSRARLASSLSDLSSNLSRLTGYEAIDGLKLAVVESEARLQQVREGANGLKRGYDEAVERRSRSMKEVNDLLSRKNSWSVYPSYLLLWLLMVGMSRSDEDLARFTTLVRTDHANEQAEAAAKTALDEVESKVDAAFTGPSSCRLDGSELTERLSRVDAVHPRKVPRGAGLVRQGAPSLARSSLATR